MSNSDLIYLDHNATTPVDPRVLEAMIPFFHQRFGNPSSSHGYGQDAAGAIHGARERAAGLIRARAEEIVFTSGATESSNLAIKGAARFYGRPGGRGRHIITSLTEHPSVLQSCADLEDEGFEVTWLKPPESGVVSAEQVAAALRPDTILLSIMWANNETGVVNEVESIASLCRSRGVLVHTDATQYVGRRPVDVEDPGIDLLSWTSHKMYGPKGIGALYVRRRRPHVHLHPLLHGGGQEQNLRAGTLNVPGIIGFATACELAASEGEGEAARQEGLRGLLEQLLTETLEGVEVNGDSRRRIPNTTNLALGGIDARELMGELPTLALSAGSACHSSGTTGSPILRAMGLGEERARGSIRFSLGQSTTRPQIREAARLVAAAVSRLRLDEPADGARRTKSGEKGASTPT